jgi:hypothetical protein
MICARAESPHKSNPITAIHIDGLQQEGRIFALEIMDTLKAAAIAAHQIIEHIYIIQIIQNRCKNNARALIKILNCVGAAKLQCEHCCSMYGELAKLL